MKTYTLIQILIIVFLGIAKGEQSEVDKFMKEHPAYVAVPVAETRNLFDYYYADAACKTERKNLKIYMFSRKGAIIGFMIHIENASLFGGENLIKKAIIKTYKDYREIQSSSGADFCITIVNDAKLKIAENDQTLELSEMLKP